jgi:hypothetical protein
MEELVFLDHQFGILKLGQENIGIPGVYLEDRSWLEGQIRALPGHSNKEYSSK